MNGLFPKGSLTTPDEPGDSELMRWIHDHRDYQLDYCLIWPFGRTSAGYGSFGREGKAHFVHRYMCEYTHGPAPSPAHAAAHSCGRGHDGCANPRHVSWKTLTENQHDRRAHGTAPIRRTKLTGEQALEIRALKGIELVTVTAERYGISEAAVRQIHAGKLWRPNSRLWNQFTDEQIREIRASSDHVNRLATKFSVSTATIYRIRSRASFRHVPDVPRKDFHARPLCARNEKGTPP